MRPHDLQLDRAFSLVPIWRPRSENVRADYLSRVLHVQLHDYALRGNIFRSIDAEWDPHTIVRFATRASCQPLAGVHKGRFCSLFFHPEAVWTDALSVSWVQSW